MTLLALSIICFFAFYVYGSNLENNKYEIFADFMRKELKE